MDDKTLNLEELARKIADAHGKNHLSDFEPLGVSNYEELVKHFYQTLKSKETELIRCNDNAISPKSGVKSTNAGVCVAYNEKSNTMLIFKPFDEQHIPTAHRPKLGRKHFNGKITNIETDQGGQTPDIKHDIYELLPELKREAELHKSHTQQPEHIHSRGRGRSR
jgi:hypothetical protein